MSLPTFRFAGSHRDIGLAHGASCASLVRRHRDLALARLEASGVAREVALAAAMEYRPYVVEHAPYLDDEIAGVAEGAGIDLAEAYLLQLRAEVYARVLGRPEASNECTTFAATPAATSDGRVLAGQNADLPAIYQELMIVMELHPDDGPSILMVTPAGQVSYIGMSSAGMAVFANFLHCDGWGLGFPRYLLSRYALAQGSVETALAGLERLPRASSRHLMMIDQTGRAISYENTPARGAAIQPLDGLAVHANHYLSADLADEERANERALANSRVRQRRAEQIFGDVRGVLTPDVAQALFRDRANVPDAISVEPGDDPQEHPLYDYITVTSVIASPATSEMWVSAGPPSAHPYTRYALSEVGPEREIAPAGDVGDGGQTADSTIGGRA
ncbi:MAG: C45 family autoproteolytic acyltransferase/hydrolase [Microcella sp.]